jgi:hypothetical protein
MEVQDGFIPAIYNYCDRWCERCAFTSYCRLFADHAEMQAALDANFKPIADAPPLAEEVASPPPQWLQELIDEANEASRTPLSPEERERLRSRVPPVHKPIERRARAYARRTNQWLTSGGHEAQSSDGPSAVISWFHFFIAAKVRRALTVWPDDDSEFLRQDADGSAKVALHAIDQSHAAWLELIERGAIARRDAEAFIADLVWLGEALEGARPDARTFIRPGLDQPDAIAQLRARGE